MHIKRLSLVLLAAILTLGPSVMPAFADAEEQAIFNDERQMTNDNRQQLQQYQSQEQAYKEQMQAADAAKQPYRLYAEQRVQQLEKLKAAGGSPSKQYAKDSGQLYALEGWLKRDAQDRAQEQARVKALDQAIANLRDSTNASQENMSSAITSMREDENQKAADDSFNKMMQINNFNELQSEMGACSWGRPPTDGTFNSTGGYGMGGGFGYSAMGRRGNWRY